MVPAGNAELRAQLADAQATLRAIRKGEVDAVVVDSKLGPHVYTLEGADFDYRVLIESMSEGALVLTREAVIVYANSRFGQMVERPLTKLMGSSLFEVLSAADRVKIELLLGRPGKVHASVDLLLQRALGKSMPVRVSIRRLHGKKSRRQSIGMVVSDLTEFQRREDLLRDFSLNLMQMQESERRQLAVDLGDNITQLLCTILARCQLLANRLPPGEDGFREEARGFATLLRTTASEAHRISADLRPHGLELLGLDSAVRGLATEFSERAGIPIEVHCDLRATHLDDGASLVVYRILQEALRNVEQHAQARHVRLTLRRRGSAIQLSIEDDGIGFDARALKARELQGGGFGLLSMRERARAVGGTVQLKSAKSGGTKVLLRVPLSAKPPASPAASVSTGVELERRPGGPLGPARNGA